MFSKINNIGYFVTNFGSKIQKIARSKAVVAAAVAATGLGISGSSFGAFTDVTSVSTQFTTGTPTTVDGVSGYGPNYNAFVSGTSWNVTYDNDTDKVLSLVAGGTTYDASSVASKVVVRQSVGPDNEMVWSTGSYNAKAGTVTLQGPQTTGAAQALDQNNLLEGADNIFNENGNLAGDNTNIDRVDMLFTNGITASSSQAFTVMERGLTDAHDGFKIAAITSLDANGNPASYGPLLSESTGAWGKTNLLSPQTEVITRKNDSIAGDALHPADVKANPGDAVGGVLIATSDLVPSGTKIYGYSLFATSVTGSGSELVNWTDTNYFKPANESTGGLDPDAVSSVLYSSVAVPEPATAGLAALAAGALMFRRPRRQTV
jgi:predicted ribosomally synthesized peptide with SipW-like signal peptide